MRYKTLFITIVLNIGAMLFFSIIYEYIDLTERFQSIDNTMNTAMECALEASTASEELFSEESNTKLYSAGEKRGNTAYANDNVNTSILMYDRDAERFVDVDVYKLAVYYGINSQMPKRASLIENGNYRTLGDNNVPKNGGFNTSVVFNYLYGLVGSSYNSNALGWSNRNITTHTIYGGSFPTVTGTANSAGETIITNQLYGDNGNQNDSARKANTGNWNALESYTNWVSLSDWARSSNNFDDFYNKVGKYAYSYSYMKKKNSDEFDVEGKTFPVLVQMGVNLDSEYNSTSSTYMLDNFCSSLKVGKRRYDDGDYSYYFLTPYSCGTTYVPVSVFKPAFTSVLDATIRLNKLASASSLDNPTDADSDGCVGTSVYVNTSASEEHVVNNDDNIYNTSSGANSGHVDKEFIVNDGNIEYDLNSVECRVDYFVYDAFKSDDKSANITTHILGANTGITEKATIELLNSADYLTNSFRDPYYNNMKSVNSGVGGISAGNSRIVAKVTTKVKVHAPYRSSIIQWACRRSDDPGHYSVKRWNANDSKLVGDDDGLWYQSEVYYSNMR